MFVQVIQLPQADSDAVIDTVAVGMQNAGAAADVDGNLAATVMDLGEAGTALFVFDAAVGARILRGLSARVPHPWRSLSLETHAGELFYAERLDPNGAEDLTGEAKQVLEEWRGESPVGPAELGGEEGHLALAFVLLGLPEDGGWFVEELRFSIRDRGRWLQVNDTLDASSPLPARWRRFVHADGRRWAVREDPKGFDLEIGVDDDLVRRRRAAPDAAAQVRALIERQLHDGFVEVDVDPTFEPS